MNMAYLGFWSDPIGWVMEHILDPVFSFVGDLLNTALTWLFQTVMGPLLKNVLIPLSIQIAKWVFNACAGVFYTLMANVWKFLDSMEQAYNIFIGIKTVQITTGDKTSDPMTLLEALYSIGTIHNAFWYIFVVSLVLLFMFTIYAVAKSIFDLETEKPRTVSHVMNLFLRSCVQFLIVPMFVLFMIRFSGVLVTTLDNSLQESGASSNATIGSTLFVISSLDASTKAQYNISTASAEDKPTLGINDKARKNYYTNGSKDKPNQTYWNYKQVEQDFVYAKFDYIVGFGVGVFVFFVMVSNSVVFIQRIFDMLLLYIVSPFFVSTMPLDDGERFKRWRELFLGKSISGLGGIVAMKLYLMIVPIIISGQITFTSLSSESVETVYVLKILFLLGGAWAATKSGSMVTGLISSSAGSAEGQAANMGNTLAWGALTTAYSWSKKAAGWGIDAMSGGKPEERDEDFEEDDDEGGEGGAATAAATGDGDSGKIPGLSTENGAGTGAGAGAGTGAAGGAESNRKPMLLKDVLGSMKPSGQAAAGGAGAVGGTGGAQMPGGAQIPGTGTGGTGGTGKVGGAGAAAAALMNKPAGSALAAGPGGGAGGDKKAEGEVQKLEGNVVGGGTEQKQEGDAANSVEQQSDVAAERPANEEQNPDANQDRDEAADNQDDTPIEDLNLESLPESAPDVQQEEPAEEKQPEAEPEKTEESANTGNSEQPEPGANTEEKKEGAPADGAAASSTNEAGNGSGTGAGGAENEPDIPKAPPLQQTPYSQHLNWLKRNKGAAGQGAGAGTEAAAGAGTEAAAGQGADAAAAKAPEIPPAPPLQIGVSYSQPENWLSRNTDAEPEAWPISERQAANERAEQEKAALPPQKTKRFLGLTFKTGRDGKYGWNVNMGGLFSNTYGADGSHTVKILGFTKRINHKGKTDKLSFLGFGCTWDNMGQKHGYVSLGKLYQQKVAADGSRHYSIGGSLFTQSFDSENNLTSIRALGVERQRNTETGEMYTRRNVWTGLEKVQDKAGNVHVKSHYGKHYVRDRAGNYNFSHGWGVTQRNMVNENGEAEAVSRSFMGFRFYEATSKRERLSQLDVNKPKEKKEKKDNK